MSDQSLHEAIGWLVSAAGRELLLKEAERAESVNPGVASHLRDWAERLTSDNDRDVRIRMASTLLIGQSTVEAVIFPPDAERFAELALRGAGVIR